MKLYHSFILFFGGLHAVAGFPNGAGSCEGDKPAVGGEHLEGTDRIVETGSLSDGQVEVTIDGEPLSTTSAYLVDVGRNYTVKLTALGEPIRGVLIRQQCRVDLRGSLLPDDDLMQVANICQRQSNDNSVVGITHTSRAPKTSISATLNLPSRITVSFDITVVMGLNATHTVYYYTGHSVRATHNVCEVCGRIGRGFVVGDRDAVIPQPSGNNLNCGEIEDAGQERRLTQTNCDIVKQLAPRYCKCTFVWTGEP